MDGLGDHAAFFLPANRTICRATPPWLGHPFARQQIFGAAPRLTNPVVNSSSVTRIVLSH